MPAATSELLPIWRSRTTPMVLHAVLSNSGPSTSASIAAQFGLSRETTNEEVRHLEAAGLVQRRAVGRSKIVTAVADHPALSALRTLVELSVGPLVELRSLYRIDGVRSITIFGSWARRHLGEPGLMPHDVDVLVVTDGDAEPVYQACLGIGGRLSLAIEPLIVSPSDVSDSATDPILSSILATPLVEVRR